MPAHRHRQTLKRVIDVIASSVALLLVLPLLLIVSVLIRLDDRGPVFYKQRRVGLNLREFDLLKFRSMRVNRLLPEEVGPVAANHPLVTRTGRVTRRFKIDELPQLINVLRGEMSLVGPRPTIVEQVQRYTDFERRRLLVRPGLTGWAQVNGNTQLSWAERIALDVWYVDHWSWWLDLQILVRTVLVVLLGERVNRKALAEALSHANSAGRSSRE